MDNLRFKYNIPTQEMLNEFRHSLNSSQVNPISPFINVVRVFESTYILKEMKYSPSLPEKHFQFEMIYRQAVKLYDNDSMLTYLNPVTILAKKFQIDF